MVSMNNADTPIILVVDDEAMNRELLEAILHIEHYQVYVARDGQTALQAVADHQPDLILLDVRMPDLSGFEVCEQLRSNPTTAHIPIVLLSGFDESEERERGMNAGADLYLARPFGADTLLTVVRRFLNA